LITGEEWGAHLATLERADDGAALATPATRRRAIVPCLSGADWREEEAQPEGPEKG
jgi:hypothetical protein